MQGPYREYLLEGERAGARYALAAPRRVPLGAAGMHQGARAGSSLEFKEHRDYQPGDDLRHIDWNAYARSDQLTVKLFHEEVNPHLDLVLDGSRSMALEGSAKARAALSLAALLATAAGNAGYAHQVWLTRDGSAAVAGGNGRPGGWEEIAFDFRGSPADAFARRPPAWRPRGLRVLVSDLLWPGDPLHLLGPCAERATALAVIQLLAEADVSPPAGGNLRLVDSETDEVREVFVDGAAVRRYGEALARHQQNWHEGCRQVGATFVTLVAERYLRDRRLDELVAAEFLKVV
jgi:uncharacterized protein (DUF58 family)